MFESSHGLDNNELQVLRKEAGTNILNKDMQGRLADKNKLSAFLEERNAYMERTKNNQSKEYIKILFSTVLKKYGIFTELMDNTGSEKGNDINKNIEPVNDNMNNKTHENNNLPINTNVDKDKVLGDNKVINKQKVEELNKEMDVLTEQSDKDIQQNIDLLESVSLSEILKNNVKNMFSFIPSIQTFRFKDMLPENKKTQITNIIQNKDNIVQGLENRCMNMKNSMPIITKENYKSPEILEQIQSLMTKFFLEYIFQFSKYLPEISESGKDEINLMEKTLLENKDMAGMWQNLCKGFYLTSISAYLGNKKRDIERKGMNINSISGINTFQGYETTKDSNNRMYNFLSKKDSEENSQCKEIANILKKNYTFKRKFNVYNDADIDYTKYKKQVTINGNNYSFFQTSFGTTGYNSNLLNIEVATKEGNKMTLCIDKKKEIFQSMTVDGRKVRIDIRREGDIMKSIDHLSSSHFISNKNNENAIGNYYIASDTKNKPSTDNISPQQLKNCIGKIYSDMLSLNLGESYEQN